MDEQLDMTFRLFDLNEDQNVSKDEVKKVVLEVYKDATLPFTIIITGE